MQSTTPSGARPALPPAQNRLSARQVKLVLLGEAAVGKSSLVLRFVRGEFHDTKEPTIGAAFVTQKVRIPEDPQRVVKFEIWDTAGQERFNSLAPMYYRNAQAAIVVYDILQPSTLDRALHWVRELQLRASPNIIIVLAGNKSDLLSNVSEPVIDRDQVLRFCHDKGILFYETSAKTGCNVAEMFTDVARNMPASDSSIARNLFPVSAGETGGSPDGSLPVRLKDHAAGPSMDQCGC